MIEGKTFDSHFVESLIPQKFPFVMVSQLIDYSETTLISGFTVKSDNIFFLNGYLQESGMIEHMAQSVALHTGYQFYLRQEVAPAGYIGSIKDLNIVSLPKLNDVVVTSVNIIQEFGGITLVSISTKLNGEEIASGQMKTVLAV
ncbi:MAG TPA: hypothetical protein VGB44_12285 [Flavobacterium sp.]|jgi:predicted hotdog family 3-hydroxylacyl-ACP dehydratase